MKLTRLRRSSRAPSHLMVEIDGARFALLPEEQIAELGLRVGMIIGDETLARIEAAGDAAKAYQRALRLLAVRPRATQELLRRLRAAGHNPSAAAEAVGRLEVQGLLDDAEFARHFARTRSPRGHGPGRLRRDLLARGVERRVADVAIAQVLDEEGTDVAVQAEELARRRARQLGAVAAEVKLRRIVGYLGRRGFMGGGIVAMVRRVIEEVSEV